MDENQNQGTCSCVIENWPATTSMLRCPEHGMPQNLEETEYPGSVSKCALLMKKPRTDEIVAIAPIYTVDQVQQCRLRGEQLGLRYFETVTIYSPVDLDRIQGNSLPERPNPKHEPGCVFSNMDHPGRECYVQDPN